MHLKRVFSFCAGLLFALNTFAGDLSTRSPFGISVTAATNAGGEKILRADFTVPPDCVLYFDRLHFRTIAGDEVTPLMIPKPLLETDKVTGKEKKVYDANFSVELRPADFPEKKVAVKFQGCTNAACFFPETRIFVPDATGVYAEVENAGDQPPGPVIAAATAGSVKAIWQSLDLPRSVALMQSLKYCQIGNPIGIPQVDRTALMADKAKQFTLR